MDHDSISSPNGDEPWQKQLSSNGHNLQVKGFERTLLERDKHIALLERSILEKSTLISAIEKQNHELLQKMHAVECTCKLAKKGETEKKVVDDLPGKSDENTKLAMKGETEKNVVDDLPGKSDENIFLPYTLSKSKWDKERFANRVPGLYQELELPKSDKSIKMYRNNLNEISWISYLAQEVDNRDIINGQRNTCAMPEKNTSINGIANSFEGHLTRESCLVNNTSEDTADVILESPLKSMSKEQLITHYLRVVAAIRRDKESMLAEKTEEIYRLKRDILRMKVDRATRILRRNLDDMTEDESELKALYDSKQLEHSLRESYLLNQIAELENEKEEIEAKNRMEIDIFKNCLEGIINEKMTTLNMAAEECGELRKQKHCLEQMMQDKDRILSLGLIEKEDEKEQKMLMEKWMKQKEYEHKVQQGLLEQSLKECQELKRQHNFIETLIQEKEDALDSAKREQDDLKKQIVLLKEAVEKSGDYVDLTLRDLEETRKDKLVLEEAIQEREKNLDNILEEKRKRTELESIIIEKDFALNLSQRENEKHMKETILLKESFEQTKAELERCMVHIKEEEQNKQSLEADVRKLEDSIKSMQLDFQMEQEQRKVESSRLEEAESQLITLHGLVHSYAFRESYYKKMYERKCSNLQKAEEEVDLLGDEVDNLLSVLGKISCVLNHYAPILQHYPGILDLVKLIKRENMGHDDIEIKNYDPWFCKEGQKECS